MNLAREFLSLLAEPATGESFVEEEKDGKLKTLTSHQLYQVTNNIPILLLNHSTTPSEFDYQAHYKKDAEVFDYSKEFQNPLDRAEVNRLRQAILSMVPTHAKWVLDVGCGSGWLAKSLIPQNRNVVSMDIGITNPQRAIRTTPSPHHFGLVADAMAPPFKKSSFDCIVASEIIEHIIAPQQFLNQLAQLLKPGGRLIVTTPYNEKINYSLCIHCNQLTPHHAHLHSFTQESIKQIAPEEFSTATTSIFNSKLLVYSRLILILRPFPFAIWKIIDRVFIRITGRRAFRLMLCLAKSEN